MNSAPATDRTSMDTMRQEIRLFGSLLGETISHIAGDDALATVERIRKLAWERRSGEITAESQLIEIISGLDNNQLRIVIRAFTLFLDILNLAEDRQRIRILAERRRKAFPNPAKESIASAVLELQQAGRSADDVEALLDRLAIQLVFTAHPTDTKRRSVRGKLKRLRSLFERLDHSDTPEETNELRYLIKIELAKLWQTDLIRPWRPGVMQEVQRGLSFKPVLWQVVPKLLEDLRKSVKSAFGLDCCQDRSPLTFGSWIGGDRDGHPGVTSEITEQTLGWLRQAAMQFHLEACLALIDSHSISERQLIHASGLTRLIDHAVERWPILEQGLNRVPPNELCRKWLAIIHWRLKQTATVGLDRQEPTAGAYANAQELLQDVQILYDVLADLPAGDLLQYELRQWMDRIRAFGFHLACLDVRQDSGSYQQAMDEVWQQCGICETPSELSENQRRELLTQTLKSKVEIPDNQLSDDSREIISLLRLLHRTASLFGADAIGGHVISMTHSVCDILTVLWLWEHTRPTTNDSAPMDLHIMPLFETIDDLHRAPQILDDLLANEFYREQLQRRDNKQTVMLGYSDSTKDGGYVSATWSVYTAQQQLHAVAVKHHIELTFFHGRGGSLGRGGGPAARSILSLPKSTFHGSLRLTEQGEVLADRYDDEHIARRHLEQMLWSSLIAGDLPGVTEKNTWREVIEEMAEVSLRHYRRLIEHPEFVQFFRTVTPISEIEQLPIGSRPARRKSDGSLKDLRAIPWVFSWTQCRCLIPAWYGLGTAIEDQLKAGRRHVDVLKDMYAEWPFFRAIIDNAELALAKTDIDIANHYLSLASSQSSTREIAEPIAEEFIRTRDLLGSVTGHRQLLDQTPWLKESIRVRDRYVDPLNLIQVELLARRQSSDLQLDEAASEELRHLTRLTVNGIAAGMRTSG